jgi:ABC-2 type transport system ATP-binding protein
LNNAAPPAIAVSALGKTFRPAGTVRELVRGRLRGAPVTALTDVTFSVARGEIVCIMGHNGAGKTTLLRILAGLLSPTAGHALVAGEDVQRAGTRIAFRRRVGFIVGDERSFHWSLTGRQNLRYFAALHGLPDAHARLRVDLLLDRVGLGEAGQRRFVEYSRGMRQRLAIARGLLGDPEILLLDEPSLGVDPKGAYELRRYLRDEVVRGAGRTALVGSNDPAEARALADRVLYLERGALSGTSTPGEVESFLGLDDG